MAGGALGVEGNLVAPGGTCPCTAALGYPIQVTLGLLFSAGPMAPFKGSAPWG